MKKPKFNFGQGGMKGFLTQHVEKIVLGVVMLLVGVFVYSGYKREGYEKGDPQDMKTKAASAKQYVNEDHSIQVIEEEKRDKIENFPALVAKSRRAIPSSDYAVAILNPAPFPPTLPRQDPTLLPPEKVEVEGMLVAVYEKPEDPTDPYLNDKAGSIIATGPAPKKAPPKKDKDKGGGDDMPGMMPGMPGLDGGGKGKGNRGGGKGAGGGAPALLPGGPGGPGGGEPDLLGGPGGGGDLAGGMGGMMPGLGGGGGGGTASLSADYIEKYVNGFRPGGAGGMVGPSMPNMQGPTQNASPFRPVSRYVVAVKAVVPHKQMADEYTRVFAEAQGYNPARDTPTYVYYYVERAEVGADPNAPLDWKRLSTNGLKARMANWGGIMPEVADPRYLDPMLSSPAPPAMMVDPAKLTLHSQVPRSTAVPEAPSQPGNASGGPGQQGDSGSDVPGGDVPGGFPAAPGMPGMPGMPGAGGMAPGMPGMPGAGGMAPGMPGMPGAGGMAPGMPGLPGAGGGAPALLPGAGGGGMAPGMMPGMGGGDGGMMMPGMGGMSGGYVAEAVKYKMIRFYDFDVQPGKKYKYRVRVLVEDPNYPRMADYAPDPRTLSATVSQRVKAAEDADTKKKTRTFWRETEWSQPSDAVGVPETVRFVGGSVQPGRSFEIRDQKLTVQLEEPVGSLLPVVWDINRAVEVPGFSDASEDPKKPEDTKPTIYRGSVLNFAKDVNVLRPDTLEVKKIEKNAFKTGALVLDMRPGEPVRDGEKKLGEKKEPPKSAGEMLIVDAQGRMVVRNELDDIEDFRRLMFVGESSSSSSGGAAGGLGGPGMPGGMPGMMPGAGGADGGAAMPGMMPGMPGGDGGGGRKGRK